MTIRARSRSGHSRFVWNAIRRLYPPMAMAVGAPAEVCLRTLAEASRPSTQRLHLRDLFIDGRRYYIQPVKHGFKLTSDHRPMWGRGRTRVGAYLVGEFASLQGDDNVTLVRLKARMYILYALSALLIPTFFASIIVYMPWNNWLLLFLIAALYILSLLGHRMNAAMQVNEMVWFVQKAFEDLPPAVVRELPARQDAEVVYSRGDFTAEWQRFYKEQSDG